MTRTIEDIRRDLEAATPGPWLADENNLILADEYVAEAPLEANAALIAHAPEDLAMLLAAVDRLEELACYRLRHKPVEEDARRHAEAKNARLREVLDAARDVIDNTPEPNPASPSAVAARSVALARWEVALRALDESEAP